jgi:hypothetical protein
MVLTQMSGEYQKKLSCPFDNFFTRAAAGQAADAPRKEQGA